jgi:hypothetical protein
MAEIQEFKILVLLNLRKHLMSIQQCLSNQIVFNQSNSFHALLNVF